MQPLIDSLSSAAPLRVVLFLTAITVLPGVLISMTAFLRISLVLSFLRHALGLQIPPNQVLIGISLFLTYFVMAEPADRVWNGAVSPYLEGKMREPEALEKARAPLAEFMLEHTRDEELMLMLNLANAPDYERVEEIPLRTIVPAFLLSELRTAFSIGFLLFIPFLVIDLAVAALLNALGMIMLPPTAIALPFKVLIFVLADGWTMVVTALVRSFTG